MYGWFGLGSGRVSDSIFRRTLLGYYAEGWSGWSGVMSVCCGSGLFMEMAGPGIFVLCSAGTCVS